MRISKQLNRVIFWIILFMPLLSVAEVSKAPASDPVSTQIAYLRLTEGYWQIWLTDKKGKVHDQLTFDALDKTRLSWFPDRIRILYSCNDGHIYTINTHNKTTARLEIPYSGIFDANLSPDGEWISFSLRSSQEQDNNDLWLMRLDGNEARKILNQPGVSQMAIWSPTGDYLVYTQSKGRDSHQLWQLNIKTGKTEQLTIGDAKYFDPNLNTKKQLIYTSNRSGNYDIWMNNKDGKSLQVTENIAYDSQPSWSPDGREITFYSQRGNQRRIWVKNIASGNVRAITPEKTISRNPAW
jgi:Tol biopolymer transport system component